MTALDHVELVLPESKSRHCVCADERELLDGLGVNVGRWSRQEMIPGGRSPVINEAIFLTSIITPSRVKYEKAIDEINVPTVAQNLPRKMAAHDFSAKAKMSPNWKFAQPKASEKLEACDWPPPLSSIPSWRRREAKLTLPGPSLSSILPKTSENQEIRDADNVNQQRGGEEGNDMARGMQRDAHS